MSQNQRIVSQPLDLHSFSIVNKQSEIDKNNKVDNIEANDSAISTKDDVTGDVAKESASMHSRKSSDAELKVSSPRKTGIQLPIPLESTPVKHNPELNAVTSAGNPESHEVDEQYQQILYKLATKKRTITELMERLKSEEKELKVLEEELSRYAESKGIIKGSDNGLMSPSNKGGNEMLQTWAKQIHSALDEVNKSPNVVNSKKSISDFFYNKQQDPKTPSARSNNSTAFFKQLVDKFSEFTFNEEEEEEFDKSRKIDEYSLNNTLNYEYDESNIDDEEVPEGILNLGQRKKIVSKPLNIKR